MIYDMANPGVFITLDRKKNALLVFDAKGSNKNFECSLKGILRFGSVLQEIRDGLSFDKMYIQTSSSLLFLTMKHSNKFVMIAYNPKNMVSSLLLQSPQSIVLNGLYTVGSDE